MTDVCGAEYLPPDAYPLAGYRCTFRKDHDKGHDATAHSWKWIKDEHDAKHAECEALHASVAVMVANIEAGTLDPFLEAILEAGHKRKRARHERRRRGCFE